MPALSTFNAGRSRAPGCGSALRFVVAFAVVATTFLGIYYFPYSPSSRMTEWIDAYLHAYAAIAGAALGWFEPHLEVVGPTIVGRYAIRIVRTCDAMDVKILFLSAVLASPARWTRRLAAATAGVFCLFCLNVVRICSLYYIGIYAPGWFEFAHLELWPLLVLAVAVGMFLFFLDRERGGHGRVSPR